jgi:hypothetical protein
VSQVIKRSYVLGGFRLHIYFELVKDILNCFLKFRILTSSEKVMNSILPRTKSRVGHFLSPFLVLLAETNYL